MAQGNPDPCHRTRFKPGVPTNMKAGGCAGAIKDIAAGRPLRGALAEIEYRKRQDIETRAGRLEELKNLAATLLALVEGLRAVCDNAVAQGDEKKFVAYAAQTRTHATRAGQELRAYDALLEQQQAALLDYDELLQQLKGGDGH